jgi:hypothetical protein
MAIGNATIASGENSFSGGVRSVASFSTSFSFGYETVSSGGGSVAFGSSTKATAYHAFAMGHLCQSNGSGAATFGEENLANGANSFAIGSHTKSLAHLAFSMGNSTEAIGYASTAFGVYSHARGNASTTFGYGTIANSMATVVIGTYNDTTNMTNPSWYGFTDPVFVVGYGTSETDRKNAFTVLQNSYVGINMVNPQYLLDIAGGSARVESGFSWLTSSDARYKKNISTLDNALDEVMAMRGVRFDLINDNPVFENSGRNIGFIAQELETVVPEVVVTGPDGYKSVAYDKITAVLTEAIKEQQKQIEAVKQENQQLKSEVDELKTLVNSLIANQTRQDNN